jgi:hypothetical protein
MAVVDPSPLGEMTVSPFVKGLAVGVIGYWAVQHFSGFGKTGKPKASATPGS